MKMLEKLFSKRNVEVDIGKYSGIPENMELRVNLLHGDLKDTVHDMAWLVHKKNGQCWYISNYWNRLGHTGRASYEIRWQAMKHAIDCLNEKKGTDYIGTGVARWIGDVKTEMEWHDLLLSERFNINLQ